MPVTALIALLTGALLHASWNAIIKAGPDTGRDATLVACGAGITAIVTLPFVGWPAVASLPYLAGSTVLQVATFLLVGATYRSGDMSRSYPLMRGTAPLLVAIASGPLMGEHLTGGGWSGVGLVCGGVVCLAMTGGRQDRAATALALTNAVVIAGYTLVDGVGVRLSGNPAGYTLTLALLTAGPMLAIDMMGDRPGLAAAMRRRWRVAILGGVFSLGSYGLALWAMTVVPVALAAALRELSILFAMALSAAVLKEPVGPFRLACAAVVTFGAIVLRLSA